MIGIGTNRHDRIPIFSPTLLRRSLPEKEDLKISTAALCKKTGMSRQNFYKGRTRRERQDVEAERALQPRLGGKKLHRLLRPKA